MNFFTKLFKKEPKLADQMRALCEPDDYPVSENFYNKIVTDIGVAARNKQRILEYRYDENVYWKDVQYAFQTLKKDGFVCDLLILGNSGGKLTIRW